MAETHPNYRLSPTKVKTQIGDLGRRRLTPTVKLTLSYLAILMVLSLVLTAPLYRLSVGESERSLRQERLYFEGINPFTFNQSYQQIESSQIKGIHNRLRNQLIVFNGLVLVIGGGVSFLLARRTLRPIEMALAAQTRFAADASHELRTPLTAMKSEIEVALRDRKLSAPEARELLGSNLEEVVKLESLAAGLLRLARADSEPIDLMPVELSTIVDRAVTRVESQASKQNVILEVGQINATVRGDADSLVELVVVLLDNAIKYSVAGKTVSVSANRHGGMADLTVKDSGSGIPVDDLPHIFERFYRADTSRSKITPGYGLGLSIAAQIVQLHHGTIDATSRLGGGSTFVVHLPLEA
jgi:two-component system sensor histidine kinase CiaH